MRPTHTPSPSSTLTLCPSVRKRVFSRRYPTVIGCRLAPRSLRVCPALCASLRVCPALCASRVDRQRLLLLLLLFLFLFVFLLLSTLIISKHSRLRSRPRRHQIPPLEPLNQNSVQAQRKLDLSFGAKSRQGAPWRERSPRARRKGAIGGGGSAVARAPIAPPPSRGAARGWFACALPGRAC